MSEIIGKSYNPYAMPSGGHGLASGFAMGRQIAKERGLANGVRAYVDAEANGDKVGMQKAIGLMAGVAPAETMDWMNKQKALDQKNLEKQFNTTNEIKNYNALIGMGVDSDRAREIAFKVNQNPSQTLTPYEKTAQMEQAKTDIEVKRGNEDFEKMKPSVVSALDRATESLKSGTGIGPVGGTLTKFGFSPFGSSASNYANIESANTQMNQILRSKLKATGLTGSELNSAVEANAYRYTISPTDNEGVVLQKIENFKNDVLNADKPVEVKKEEQVIDWSEL